MPDAEAVLTDEQLRHRRRRERPLQGDRADQAAGPEELATQRAEVTDSLEVAGLTLEERASFVLIEGYGFTAAEVAMVLGRCRQVIVQRRQSARAKVRSAAEKSHDS